MTELIGRWNTSAQSLEVAASMTDEICARRYGNHFSKLKKDQRREFQRLQSESKSLRDQASVYRKCATDLSTVAT